MIVKLTLYHWNVIRTRVPHLHAEAMRSHRERHGRSQHLYDLPAIAWRQILNHLLATCYGPLGGKQASEPRSLYSAVKRISDAVMRIEKHPALRGAAVEGWVGDVIPVWAAPDLLSVYPVDGVFMLLEPVHELNRELEITRWVAQRPGTPGQVVPRSASWTFTEASHLRFIS